MNEQIPNNNKEKSNILLDIISNPIAIVEEIDIDSQEYDEIIKTKIPLAHWGSGVWKMLVSFSCPKC